MAKRAKQHTACQQTRRWKETHYLLNPMTGVQSQQEETWVTGPCNVPLFSDAERASGLCRSCAKGWTHPHNYPVEN